MGLDMYAYSVSRKMLSEQDADLDLSQVLGLRGTPDDETPEQFQERMAWNHQRRNELVDSGDFDPDFAYWRKFNHLHGWMERTYRMVGGKQQQFNCATVRLGDVLIGKLRIDAQKLKPTEGFFFGNQRPMDEDDVQAVLSFCDKCDAAFAKGHDVIYDSWW